MKEQFKYAWRVRRLLAKLGIDKVNWGDDMEVDAYICWCYRKDAEYFSTHKYRDTQYSWY